MIFNFLKNIKNSIEEINNLKNSEFLGNTKVFNGNILNSTIDENILSQLNMGYDSNRQMTTDYANAIDELSKSYIGANAEAKALRMTQDGLSRQTISDILIKQGYTRAERKAAMETNAFKTAQQSATASMNVNTQATLRNVAATKALSIAKKALSFVGSIVASIAFSLVITKIIEGVSELGNKIYQTKEEIKEAADTAKKSVDEIKKSFNDLKDTTDDIKQRYAELAQGVDQVSGKNLTLSTDDYNEFLDLSNQLSELFPTLTKGYDENGNAILNLSGNIDTIVGSLNGLVDAQRLAANQEILKELPNIYKEYEDNYKNYSNEVNKYDDIQPRDIYQESDKKSISFSADINKTDVENLRKKLSSLIGEEVSSSTLQLQDEMRVTFSISDDSNIDIIPENLYKIINQELTEQKNLLESETASFNKYLNTWLSGEWLYVKEGDSGLQTAIQQMLFNSDWIEQAAKNGVNTANWDEVANWLKTNYLNKIDNLSEEDKIQLSSLFSGKLSPEEALSIANELQQSFKNAGIYISLDFITDVNDEDSIANLIERVKAKNNELIENDKVGVTQENLDSFFTEQGIDSEAEYEGWLKITEGIKDATDAMNAWKEAKNTDSSNGSIFGNELNTEAIDSFQDKVSTLSSALEQMNSGDFDDNALVDLLAQFPELEGKTDNLEQAIKDLIYNALDKLYEALGGRGNVPDDIQKVLDGIAESATGAKEALNKAFPDIQASYDALKNYEKAMSKGMTDEVLSDIASLSDELYGMVAGYYANIVSADELYTALQNHYQTDLENYGNALIAKNANNIEFCDAVGLNSAEVTNQFKEDYNVDLSNHKTYAEKKLAIEQQLLTNVSKGWANYYNAQTRSFTSQMTALENMISTAEANSAKLESYNKLGTSMFSSSLTGNIYGSTLNALKNQRDTIKSAVSKYEAAIDALNDITYSGIQSSFEGVSNTLDKNAEKDKKDKEDSIETFDWVEKIIKKIERSITNLGKVVDATYRKWSTRNSALIDEMSYINDEIAIQQKAYETYIAKANSIGLSKDYIALVQSGAYNIQDITDDTLKEKIKNYETWYEKALECSDAILDLKDNLADLAKQKFDNIASEFESKMSIIEHEATMIEGFLDQTESKGYLAGFEYYEQLTKLEKDNIALLEQEYASLRNSLQESIDKGTVEIYSESWYEMTGQIFEVQEAIQEANSALIEYNNNLRELDWEIFDKTQDYISKIQEESEFIIGLMEDETLFDEDTGKWTEYADAIAGLHAVNYNAYMAQASDYASQIQEINKELAEDPYNTVLIERRQELLGLQQDMIENAESEKQSIIDLVSDGYDVMLEAMQKIIDKRKEELNLQKDLYDYQKNIESKTKTVNSLQKQLDSYSGFDDEETRAKIQQISVQLQEAKEDLEATEYDKYLDDQQQMLDALMGDTEMWINERLDQIDLLISEVIDNTNANASTISETIEKSTGEVGYTLTEEMKNIWLGESGLNKIVSVYGDNFNLMLTTTNTTLTSIRDLIQAMVNKSNEQAKQDVAETKKETAKVPGMPSSTPSTGNTSGNSTSNKTDKDTSSTSSNSSNSKWGHWFVTKKDSYPKNKLNIEKSIVDRLKFKDINSAMNYRKQYYEAMGGTGTYRGTSSQNKWMLSEMKSHGYQKGSNKILNKELAWTQEDGQELIYRSSDGAMLTPLNKGDAVFTSEMTQRLWNMAKTPSILNNPITTLPRGIISNGANNNVSNDIQMSITLPNVTNYDQFVSEMQKDSRVEKLIQNIAFSKALGKNSLNKYKY